MDWIKKNNKRLKQDVAVRYPKGHYAFLGLIYVIVPLVCFKEKSIS